MIDIVILDLGKVLVDFHPLDALKKLGVDEKVIDAFEKNIFSGIWEYCDERALDEEQSRALFKEHMKGYEKEVDLLWDNLTMVTATKPYAASWIQSIKDKGKKVYILSNYSKAAFEINSKIYDFLSLVDGMVISYQYEIVKPDRRLYEIILEKYNIDREKAVFIDDRQENIVGAANCGLKGILFESYEQANAELEKILSE